MHFSRIEFQMWSFILENGCLVNFFLSLNAADLYLLENTVFINYL